MHFGADGHAHAGCIRLLAQVAHELHQHDLFFALALTPWEAVLGAEVEVPTLDGPVLLTVPPGTRAVAPWLENWQGLRHAIATGQRIEIEHFRNEANNQEPFWLHSGKR